MGFRVWGLVFWKQILFSSCLQIEDMSEGVGEREHRGKGAGGTSLTSSLLPTFKTPNIKERGWGAHLSHHPSRRRRRHARWRWGLGVSAGGGRPGFGFGISRSGLATMLAGRAGCGWTSLSVGHQKEVKLDDARCGNHHSRGDGRGCMQVSGESSHHPSGWWGSWRHTPLGRRGAVLLRRGRLLAIPPRASRRGGSSRWRWHISTGGGSSVLLLLLRGWRLLAIPLLVVSAWGRGLHIAAQPPFGLSPTLLSLSCPYPGSLRSSFSYALVPVLRDTLSRRTGLSAPVSLGWKRSPTLGLRLMSTAHSCLENKQQCTMTYSTEKSKTFCPVCLSLSVKRTTHREFKHIHRHGTKSQRLCAGRRGILSVCPGRPRRTR